MKPKKRKVEKAVKSELNSHMCEMFDGFEQHATDFISLLSSQPKPNTNQQEEEVDYQDEEVVFLKKMGRFNNRLEEIKRLVKDKYHELNVRRLSGDFVPLQFPKVLDVVAVIFSFLQPLEIFDLRPMSSLFNLAFLHHFAIETLQIPLVGRGVELRTFEEENVMSLNFVSLYVLYRSNNIKWVVLREGKRQSSEFFIQWMINNDIVFRNVRKITCGLGTFVKFGGHFKVIFPNLKSFHFLRSNKDLAFFKTKKRRKAQNNIYIRCPELETLLPFDMEELVFYPPSDEMYASTRKKVDVLGGVPVSVLQGNTTLRKFVGTTMSPVEVQSLESLPSLRHVDIQNSVLPTRPPNFQNVECFCVSGPEFIIGHHIVYVDKGLFKNIKRLRIEGVSKKVFLHQMNVQYLTKLELPRSSHFTIKKEKLKQMVNLTALTCNYDFFCKLGVIFADHLTLLDLFCQMELVSPKFTAESQSRVIGNKLKKMKRIKYLSLFDIYIGGTLMKRMTQMETSLKCLTIDNTSGKRKGVGFKSLVISPKLNVKEVKILLELADVPEYRRGRNRSYYVPGQVETFSCENNYVHILQMNTIPKSTTIKCDNLKDLNIENAAIWLVDTLVIRCSSPYFREFRTRHFRNIVTENVKRLQVFAPFCSCVALGSSLLMNKLCFGSLRFGELKKLELGNTEILGDLSYLSFQKTMMNLTKLSDLSLDHIKFVKFAEGVTTKRHFALKKLTIRDSVNVCVHLFTEMFPNLNYVSFMGKQRDRPVHFQTKEYWTKLRLLQIEYFPRIGIDKYIQMIVKKCRKELQFFKFFRLCNPYVQTTMMERMKLSSLKYFIVSNVNFEMVSFKRLEMFSRIFFVKMEKPDWFKSVKREVQKDVKCFKTQNIRLKKMKIVFDNEHMKLTRSDAKYPFNDENLGELRDEVLEITDSVHFVFKSSQMIQINESKLIPYAKCRVWIEVANYVKKWNDEGFFGDDIFADF